MAGKRIAHGRPVLSFVLKKVVDDPLRCSIRARHRTRASKVIQRHSAEGGHKAFAHTFQALHQLREPLSDDRRESLVFATDIRRKPGKDVLRELSLFEHIEVKPVSFDGSKVIQDRRD